MSRKENVIAYSMGDNLGRFWILFQRREHTKNKWMADILTFRLNRMARRHGGYIGNGASIADIPVLPHGLHGVYISRYAHIGSNCWIYQNVTIGEADHRAPQIGDNCLLGAGAILIGGITIGNRVKIGAGAVVSRDIPDDCTVVAQPPRIIVRGAGT